MQLTRGNWRGPGWIKEAQQGDRLQTERTELVHAVMLVAPMDPRPEDLAGRETLDADVDGCAGCRNTPALRRWGSIQCKNRVS